MTLDIKPWRDTLCLLAPAHPTDIPDLGIRSSVHPRAGAALATGANSQLSCEESR